MKLTRSSLVALAVLSAACISPAPHPPVPPTPVPVPPIEQPVPTPPTVPTPPPVVVGRQGEVTLINRTLHDAGGPWLGAGTTLFWALWGEANDPDRLDRNLAFAAKEGADYVRILSMVGAASWEDRRIDPRDPKYWETAERFLARAARHGLRVQLTVFADAQVMMPDTGDRERWVDAWMARVEKDRARFITVEAANEYWQNGFDLPQLLSITKRINAQTSVLVMPSAAGCGTHPEDITTPEQQACADEWRALVEVSDLVGPHFDRDISKSDGPWRPVRQPWEMLFGPRGYGMRGYVNNEPIGPQSSVAEDDAPERMALAAAVTWLTGGAAYTLHTGGGIRGGGVFDVARGRSANLWEVPRIADTWAEIRAARAALPAILPSCRAHNSNGNFPDRPFDVSHEELVRMYQATCPDGTVVALPFGIKGSATVTARQTVRLGDRQINAGQSFTVGGNSAVLVGTLAGR